MSLASLSMQEVRLRPGRAFLTFLSVVIGVAATIAVSMAVVSARTAFSEMSRVLAGDADIRIEARGGGDFPLSSVQRLKEIPGVVSLEPMLAEFTTMYTDSGRVRLQLFGVVAPEPGQKMRISDFELDEGRSIQAPDEVLLDRGTALGRGVTLGDEVRFLTRARDGLISPKKVVGILKPIGSKAFESGSAAYWELKELQQAMKKGNKVSFAFVQVDPARSVPEVRDAIAATLPNGIDAVLAGVQSGQARDLRIMIEVGLALAAAISVLAMGFVILNTFLMNVSERKASIAILRTLGASQRHVRTMLLTEGIALGLSGALVGLMCGYGIAVMMVRGFSYGLQVNLVAPKLSIPWAVCSLLFGVLIVVVSILFPAHQAMAITPMQGMRGNVALESSQRAARWPRVLGLVIFLVGLTMAILQTQRDMVFQVGVVGGVLMLLSVVLLYPPLIPATVNCLAAVASRFWNFMPELIRNELLRHRTRTYLTWAILFVSISGAFALSSVLLDVIADVHDFLEETLHCDYVLRANLPGMAARGSAGMPLELEQEIAELPGVSRVVGIRFFTVRGTGRGMVAIARQFKKESTVPLAIRAGATGEELKSRLLGGDVVLAAIAAQQMGLKPGDKLTVEFAGVQHDFQIAATIAAYAMGGMTVVLDYDVAKSIYGIEGADVFLIDGTFAKDKLPVDKLRQMGEKYASTLQDYQELSALIDSMLTGVTASLWVVLALGFAISLFGVVNTLTMNIMEQTQELGLMRVVGMTKARVGWLVLGQALAHGLIALIPGLVCGFLLALILRSTSLRMLGKEPELSSRPLMMVLFAAGVLLLVLTAAILPARRATRIPMLAAIRRQ